MKVLKRWFPRAVAVLAALLFVVGSVTVLPPFGSQAGAYLADRNLGFALLLLVLLVAGRTRSLGAVLLATAAIHLVDGIADVALGNGPAAIGSIVVGVLSAVAAVWLLQEPDPKSNHEPQLASGLPE
jgi:hypothetical protein